MTLDNEDLFDSANLVEDMRNESQRINTAERWRQFFIEQKNEQERLNTRQQTLNARFASMMGRIKLKTYQKEFDWQKNGF